MFHITDFMLGNYYMDYLSPGNHGITFHLALHKMVMHSSERKNCSSFHLRKGKGTNRRERILKLNSPNTPALCSISRKNQAVHNSPKKFCLLLRQKSNDEHLKKNARKYKVDDPPNSLLLATGWPINLQFGLVLAQNVCSFPELFWLFKEYMECFIL